MTEFDVIISGAGPAGLTLAIDLGQRGVRTLLLEANAAPGPWPKMERCNARSMEIYRRLGLAEAIRSAGLAAEAPMDVFIANRISDPPILRLRYPCVDQARAEIAATTDDSAPREPYQLVSQYALEPVLKAAAERIDACSVRFGHEVTGFDQDETGVTVGVRSPSGEPLSFRGAYLVACDGGGSPIRKALGIALEGDAALQEMSQVQFRSDTLYDRLPFGGGRHFYFTDANGSAMVVQGNRKEFTLHTTLPSNSDFAAAIRQLIGFDVDFEVLRVNRWMLHLLVAERYRLGRVFLAGDAVHLFIPTGGLGMNSAIGDVADLGWKLAGTLAGWGGPTLLDSYEHERRPVGLFNREASRFAATGLGIWRAQLTPAVREPTPRGDAARAAIARMAAVFQKRGHDMNGAELGYHYWGSPLIMPEPGAPPIWDIVPYIPSTKPGARLPHMWLSDRRAISDVVGEGYTLIDLTGTADTAPIAAAFARAGVPLTTFASHEAHCRDVYGVALLLVRPDLHIVWRGDAPAADPDLLVRVASGHVAAPLTPIAPAAPGGIVGGQARTRAPETQPA